MRYCPICYGHRALKHLIWKIRYWWRHKVLGIPEPDPVEVIADLMPLIIMIGVLGEAHKKILKDFKEIEVKK